jgi:siroheme synthase-like protein
MGPLAIAISTAGASPALAKRMKREIEGQFGEPYARLAVLLNEVRGWAKGTLPTYQERKVFFEGIVNGDPDPIALLENGASTASGEEHSGEHAVRELIARAQDAHALRV